MLFWVFFFSFIRDFYFFLYSFWVINICILEYFIGVFVYLLKLIRFTFYFFGFFSCLLDKLGVFVDVLFQVCIVLRVRKRVLLWQNLQVFGQVCWGDVCWVSSFRVFFQLYYRAIRDVFIVELILLGKYYYRGQRQRFIGGWRVF